MKLYTSYYANIKNIPDDFFVVSVSRSLTEDLKMAVDSWDIDLAPSQSIFTDHKSDPNYARYIKRFKTEMLPSIDWLEKLESWEEKANSINKQINNIVICCYEAVDSDDGKGHFCHRHILAEHFEQEFSTVVTEYGYEKYIRDNYKLKMPISADILF